MRDTHLRTCWKMLYITYGILAIIVGLDKFFDIITDWAKYASPLILSILPFSVMTLMYLVGVIEVIAGILVFTKPKLGSFIVGVWLILIALNLVSFGFYSGPIYYDIAARDIVMAVGAFALTILTKHREERPSEF
jgi:hypothetical protein